MLDTTEKLFTLSPPDGQFEMLLDATTKTTKMLMAEINGEADTQVDKEGFDIWQPDWGLIAFSLSGRWLHSQWLFHMSDVFSRWHLISCQVRCCVIRSVTKDDKDDRDAMAISYWCSL